MRYDAFISYSTDDKTVADATCATLEKNGVRCWMAPRDVLPGQDWSAAIIDAIEQSHVLVLVFTDNANTSKQIKREVERAVHNARPIIPLRVEEVRPSKALEYYISTTHWLDALTPPLEAHLEKLAGTIKTLIEGSTDTSPPASSKADDDRPQDQDSTPASGIAALTQHRLFKPGVAVAAVLLLIAITLLAWPDGNGPPASGDDKNGQHSPETQGVLRVLASDVLAQVEQIDARLNIVKSTLPIADFENPVVDSDTPSGAAEQLKIKAPAMKTLRRSHVRSFALMASERRPKPLMTPALKSALTDLPAVYEYVQTLDKAVEQSSKRMSSMLNNMDYSAESDSIDPEVRDIYIALIKSDVEQLEVASRRAHLQALSVLDSVKKHLPPNTSSRLKELAVLRPDHLISQEEIGHELAVLDEHARAVTGRQLAAVERYAAYVDAQPAKLDDLWTVEPDDSWQVVVGKAINARKVGRITDSVRLFDTYATMFGKDDPTATLYAKIAKSFTTQAERLGVRGGLYIYEVKPDGAASKLGVRVGDIVIQYNGHTTPDQPAFIQIQQAIKGDGPFPMILLRPGGENGFERVEVSFPGTTLGISTMPI